MRGSPRTPIRIRSFRPDTTSVVSEEGGVQYLVFSTAVEAATLGPISHPIDPRDSN